MDIVEVWIIEDILKIHCLGKQTEKAKKDKIITENNNNVCTIIKMDILRNLEHISSSHVVSSPL